MPKRPAAKLMPRRRIVKVKTEPEAAKGSAKVPGKNRFEKTPEGEVGRDQESCQGRTCPAGTSF